MVFIDHIHSWEIDSIHSWDQVGIHSWDFVGIHSWDFVGVVVVEWHSWDSVIIVVPDQTTMSVGKNQLFWLIAAQRVYARDHSIRRGYHVPTPPNDFLSRTQSQKPETTL
jgi:hypothetical protein